MAYIGQAGNGLVRITRHLSEKDFWRESLLTGVSMNGRRSWTAGTGIPVSDLEQAVGDAVVEHQATGDDKVTGSAD